MIFPSDDSLLMAGRSTVFESDECTPTFSLFLYWHDPCTLPCVMACEANTNMIFLSMLSFFISFLSSRYVGHYTSLIKPFLVCPLVKREVFQVWPFKSLKDVQNVRPGCQPKLGIAQGEASFGTEGGFEDRDFQVCDVCDAEWIWNAFPAAQQKFAGFHFCILMNFVHSSNWVDIYDTIFINIIGVNNKCTIFWYYHIILIVTYLIIWVSIHSDLPSLCVHWNLPRGAHFPGSSRGRLVSDVNWCQLTSSHEISQEIDAL